MSANKICVTCGSGYKYCGHCNGYKKEERWRNNYCSENCRDIFKTVTDYIGKIIDIKEAKNRLSKCDLNITPTNQIAKYMVEILAYEEPKKKTVEKKSEVKSETLTEEVKPKRRRRKRTEE